MRPWEDNGFQRLTDRQMDDVFQRIGNRLDALEAAVAILSSPTASTMPWRAPVRVALLPAQSTNVDITAPGDPLDSVTMALGDRVVLGYQDDATQNGVWVWNGAAIPMNRAPDSATGALLYCSRYGVQDGTNKGHIVYCSDVTVPLIGIDVITMADQNSGG